MILSNIHLFCDNKQCITLKFILNNGDKQNDDFIGTAVSSNHYIAVSVSSSDFANHQV
jgi:hypothetical protein